MVIVGIDEVGRGCWAGPLVAGAVVLAEPLDGLNDSKKLTAVVRQRLDAEIRVLAAAYGLGWVTASEVDSLGLTAAVATAMRRALLNIPKIYDKVIIDGSINFLPELPAVEAIVKADGSVPCVSAASIIAKVARDAYMAEQAVYYPDFGFAAHVGYGTARHAAALARYGPTPLHRLSFKPVKAFAAGPTN